MDESFVVFVVVFLNKKTNIQIGAVVAQSVGDWAEKWMVLDLSLVTVVW